MHQDALLCIVQNDKFTLRVLGITMKEKDDNALKGYARYTLHFKHVHVIKNGYVC